MSNLEIAAVLIGAGLAAAAVRNIIPYLRKRQEAESAGETLPFTGQYVTSMVGSLVVSLPIMVMALPAMFSQLGEGASLGLAFVTGFTSVYTLNDIWNENITSSSPPPPSKPAATATAGTTPSEPSTPV